MSDEIEHSPCREELLRDKIERLTNALREMYAVNTELRDKNERLSHLYKIGKDQCTMLYNEIERLKALAKE